MNKNLADIKAQIEKLQAEYDSVLREEREAKLTEARELIATYGFTTEELFVTKKKRNFDPSKAKTYRNPETGETYGGRGKPPKSFADAGKNVWRTWEVK